NVVATAISTRAVPPRIAVGFAALLNFAGAFLSLQVAAVVAKGIVHSGAITPTVVFAGLIGAIFWNLATWWFGLPSSSSHALIGNGNLSPDAAVPTWVVVLAASAIAAGTYVGGWRIIKTVGTRIIKMDAAQGFAAQGAGAAVILTASHFGYPLSTTHVISGGVMGAGAAKRLSAVRWGIAGNIVVAWVLTLPAAGASGAGVYWLQGRLGTGVAGPLVISLIALGVIAALVLSRRARIMEPARA